MGYERIEKTCVDKDGKKREVGVSTMPLNFKLTRQSEIFQNRIYRLESPGSRPFPVREIAFVLQQIADARKYTKRALAAKKNTEMQKA